jgi:hypothetical protein
MARLNLLPNPSFRRGAQGWVAVNGASIAATTDSGFYGDNALVVTKSSISGSGFQTEDFIPVPSSNVGLPYAGSAYVQVPLVEAESSNILLKISWYASDGSQISESSSELLEVLANSGWQRISVIGEAPAGTVSLKFSLTQLVSGTAGKKFQADALLLEQSSFVGGYLDNVTQAEETYTVDRSLTPRQLPTIGGVELNADIIIGDLVLNTLDEYGVVWVCTDIEGWWGHSEPDIPDIERGIEDGSYDVEGRYKARQMTLRGVFLPPNTEQIRDARDRLISATNLVRTGAWLRTNEEPTRASYVQLSGRPQIQTVNARGRTEFSIGLKAADPIRYKWNDSTVDGFETVVIPRVSNPTSGTDVFTIVSRRATLSECTLTTSTSHGYSVGQSVAVSGVGTRYNGTFKLTAVTSNSFTYRFAGAEESSTVASGTVVNRSQITVFNEGTADVTAVFTLTGPIGAGSTITNVSNGEVLRIVEPLRGSGPIARVKSSELFNNVATLETFSQHQLVVGDVVEVYGLGEPYDTTRATITAVTTSSPYTFSFALTNEDEIKSSEDGGVSLLDSDVMTINTYDRSVTYNSRTTGQRARVDTLVDWVKLGAGDNLVKFEDSIDPYAVIFKNFDDTTGIAELTTNDAHFLVPGQEININLSEEATLARKQLFNNVVTITTTEPHGFSIGDSIDVVSKEVSTIVNKELDNNLAILTTEEENGINPGDNVEVDLVEQSGILSKSSTANVVTLQTEQAHGASIGDEISVALPTTASISNKSLRSNLATVTTATAHNFSVGDTITVTLPTTATITNKNIAESNVVLTTSASHGFSTNDRVSITLPLSATITGVSYSSGSTSRVTLTTSSAHGFDVGDIIEVDVDVPSTVTVTNRSATSGASGTCTLTTATTHNFSVGEQITVSGISPRYNGTHTITAVSPASRTITYVFGTTEETSTASSGSVTNNTIASGYNGRKVVESVTSTTLTYYYYGQRGNVVSSLVGSSPSLSNVTNAEIDGNITISSVPSATQFAYTKVA